MDLYFSPLACSMATRIALYEAGHQANFIEVDPKTKKVLKDNSDFYASQSARPGAVAAHRRRRDPDRKRRDPAACRRTLRRFRHRRQAGHRARRLQQWLCFIGTELHKGLFTPLLGKNAPAEVKTYTLEKYLSRLDYLDKYLKGREFLLDHFSVADAYLTTVLNWSIATPQMRSVGLHRIFTGPPARSRCGQRGSCIRQFHLHAPGQLGIVQRGRRLEQVANR